MTRLIIGRFDATDDPDLLPGRVWEFWAKNYWVLVLPKEMADPYSWCFSVAEPRKPANPYMHWRRPTYEEGLIRWRRARDDPEQFERQNNGQLLKYSRSANE